MRNALALKTEDDEVPVSSIELLETHAAAIRVDLNEFKNNFSNAMSRMDGEAKAAVLRLEAQIYQLGAKFAAEIRATAETAKSDLEGLAKRFDTQFQELRADHRSLRDKVDRNHETVLAKIDQTNDRIDLTNEKLSDLDRKVTTIDSKLTALVWVIGGLGTFITVSVMVGKALHWF